MHYMISIQFNLILEGADAVDDQNTTHDILS